MSGGPQNLTIMGRPRLPQADVRSERVVTFLTPPEHRHLRKLAQVSNQSLSAKCHELLVRAMQDQTKTGGTEGE
ncbi:hypothetical protein RA28_10365 [Ruegeria sp. ANG-S4]|nr:hypothetical protein RA28_10365 [Ruegeria sp. ANG-S4]